MSVSDVDRRSELARTGGRNHSILERGVFLDGVVQPIGQAVTEITHPGDNRLVGRVTRAGADDVDRAVRSAHAAHLEWRELGYAARGKILAACAAALDAHVSELVPLLVAEQGKTLREARLELHKAAETLDHHAGQAKEIRAAYVHGLDPGVDGRVLRKPLGVVAAIVPWNFPTTLLCNKLGPALVTGNAVVAKPADTTPFTTLRLAEILTEAGLPPGLLNVVTGTGPEAGEALITHPLTRKVAFTGSTPTGERVMALAAKGCKRITLERRSTSAASTRASWRRSRPPAAPASSWSRSTPPRSRARAAAGGTGRILIAYLNGRLKAFVDTTPQHRRHRRLRRGAHPRRRARRARRALRAQRRRDHVARGARDRDRASPACATACVSCRPGRRQAAPGTVVEGAYRARGRKPPVCREMVRTLLHGHRYDGSRAERELGLRYTPVAETFRRTIEWAREQGLVRA